MNIRELIIQDISTVLNNNPEGIQFVVGKPAFTANSKFSIEVPRTAEQPWYETNFEEYIPVAVNRLDGSFLPQQAFTALTLVGDVSFLVPSDRQDVVLETLFEIVEDFPGRVVSLEGYRVSYTIGVPQFVDLIIINERKHIEYNIEISVIASKNAFTAHDIQVYLTIPDEEEDYEVQLPLIAYAPVKTTDTVTIQTQNDTRATSFVKNTVWTASIAFFLTNGADEEDTPYDTTLMSLEMLKILESDQIQQNVVYGLRVKYPFGNYEESKEVVITNLQPSFTKDSIASMTITVEEVYDEVI